MYQAALDSAACFFAMYPLTLAVTSGEPAGIGPDICLDLAQLDVPCRVVVVGDVHLLRERAALLNKNTVLVEYEPQNVPPKGALEVLHVPLCVPCVCGQLNAANADYVLRVLDVALEGIDTGAFAAMVTAPVHKGIINDGQTRGEFFSGHTEYLAQHAHVDQVVMMLVGGGLRVALLTTHLPLRDVSDALSVDGIVSVAKIVDAQLRDKFGIERPRIALLGLNPHAGEGGYLGREEIDVMLPAVARLRDLGIDITDPLPADTAFQPFILRDVDVVLAAYHDQGLPVLKYASFGQGVNITLGLPFVRTSVDHGTALTLAGTARADSGSLVMAVREAWQMLNNRPD